MDLRTNLFTSASARPLNVIHFHKRMYCSPPRSVYVSWFELRQTPKGPCHAHHVPLKSIQEAENAFFNLIFQWFALPRKIRGKTCNCMD